MTEAEVSEVERKLQVKLPAFYRNVLLNYPKDLLDYFLWCGPGRTMLDGTADRLIEGNRYARRECQPQPGENPDCWRTEYFAIGTDAGGNQWCICLDGRSDAVWQYNDSDGGFFRMYASLPAYVAMLRERYFGGRG